MRCLQRRNYKSARVEIRKETPFSRFHLPLITRVCPFVAFHFPEFRLLPAASCVMKLL
jgi:hypothetical protein